MKPVDPPTLRYAVGKDSLGHVLVATRGHGLCALLLGDDAKALRAALADAFPGATLIEDWPALAAQCRCHRLHAGHSALARPVQHHHLR
ncbi:hypothetical protein ACQCR9_25400, partial [Ralstonia pseudosolanacearum]